MLKSFTAGSVLYLLGEVFEDMAKVNEADESSHAKYQAVATTLLVLGLGVDAACPTWASRLATRGSSGQHGLHPDRRERLRRQRGPRMTMITDLLDGVTDEADLFFTISDWPTEVIVPRHCHGCFRAKPDVDLWAEDTETGEQLWLCVACADR